MSVATDDKVDWALLATLNYDDMLTVRPEDEAAADILVEKGYIERNPWDPSVARRTERGDQVLALYRKTKKIEEKAKLRDLKKNNNLMR